VIVAQSAGRHPIPSSGIFLQVRDLAHFSGWWGFVLCWSNSVIASGSINLQLLKLIERKSLKHGVWRPEMAANKIVLPFLKAPEVRITLVFTPEGLESVDINPPVSEKVKKNLGFSLPSAWNPELLRDGKGSITMSKRGDEKPELERVNICPRVEDGTGEQALSTAVQTHFDELVKLYEHLGKFFHTRDNENLPDGSDAFIKALEVSEESTKRAATFRPHLEAIWRVALVARQHAAPHQDPLGRGNIGTGA
jgi:hypothetical protein